MFSCIFWTVICCFQLIQGFIELPQDILSAVQVLGVSNQKVASGNDTKLQEFASIFNHYINLTLQANENREVVSRLTSVNSTDDGENQGVYGSLEWQTALNDALTEENITVEFDKPLNDEVMQYIQTFASSPENLKALYLLYLQRQDLDESQQKFEGEDLNVTDSDIAGPSSHGTTIAEDDQFWDDTPTRRIFKGKKTKIKNYPFIVSVLVLSTFACAGSIIKNDLVITAASCLQLAFNNRFFRENPAFIEVRVGSAYFSVGGEIIPVGDVYFHPSYTPTNLHSNLAVMRLRWVLNFKHRNVKKIEFDRTAAALPSNTPPITILGWGAKTEDNKIRFKTSLHMANLDFYDFESCREIYGKKYVTRTNFCAGFISKGEGACNHDVGDPGVSGRFLVGIASFGSPTCGRPDTPTVFTKVGYYADWIEEIIEQEVITLKHRVTTKTPFRIFDKRIILYGIGGEEDPIPLEREGVEIEPPPDTAPVDADLAIVLRELKKLGVEEKASADIIKTIKTGVVKEEETPPFEEQDPEMHYNGPSTENAPIHQIVESDLGPSEENENVLREEDQDSDGLAKTKYSEETNQMEKSDSDSDDSSTDRVTKMVEFDAKYTMSRKMRKTHTDPIQTLGLRFTKIAASVKKSEAKAIPKETSVNAENNFYKTSLNKNKVSRDDRHDSIGNTRFDENIMDMPKHTSNVDDNAVHKEYAPPNILGSIHPIDLESNYKFGSIQNKDKFQVQLPNFDKKAEGLRQHNLEDYHEPTPNKEKIVEAGEFHTELANEIADDIVRREIQKLIEQLEMSSELNSETEEPKFIDNSPLQNDPQYIDKDKTKTPDTILTFYYTKKIQPRANIDASVEGLSIDAESFKKNRHRNNNFVGKSEIYEIFQNVMNTVVNKTLA